MLLIGSTLWGQEIRVTGKVTDFNDGSSLPGVTILVKGTTQGTITDANGNYSISVNPNGVLVYSFLGMTTEEVEVRGQTVINVELMPDIATLQELVVTAYGISREKKSLGYSAQDVLGESISEIKSQNLISSLSGKVAGVQITTASGAVGSSARITIRGNSSFTNNNQPLFVVDGTPISNFSTGASQWGGADFGNAAMDIDPANIESITVLKGGAASALYGQYAANGVILITTKDRSNKSEPMGVNISSSVTFDEVYILANMQNKYGQGVNGGEYEYELYLANNSNGHTAENYSYQQYAYDRSFRYYNGLGGGKNDGTDESWGPRLDIGLMLPQFNSPFTLDENGLPVYESTPWVSNPSNTRDFFQTGITYDNTIEIYGSTDISTARLSVSNMNVKGTIPNTDLTRNSVNFSGSISPSKKFNTRVVMNYVNNNSDNLPAGGYEENNVMQSIGGWFGRQVDMNDLKENWDKDDPFGRPYNWNHSYFNNPYWVVNKNTTSRNRDRVFGNITMTYELTNWLSVMGRIGNDYFTEFRKGVIADRSIASTYGGSFWQSNREMNEFNADLIFNFDYKFTDDIRVDGLLGGNYMDRSFKSSSLEAQELTVPDLYTIGNVRGNPLTGMYDYNMVSNSVFGAINTSFKNYIFLNGTYRVDWSSTLPQESWAYPYYSIGTSFVFSEAFKLESNTFSFGRIRASYAKTGMATSPYRIHPTYRNRDPYAGNTLFFISREYPVSNLVNEDMYTYEGGFELSFFNNRLGIDATYFDNTTVNQLIGVNVPSSTGFNSMLINAGEIQNTGYELLLRLGIIRKSGGLNWDMVVNWSKSKDMVNELYGDLEKYQLSSSWGAVTIDAIPGEAYGVIRGIGYIKDDQGRVVVNPNTGLPMRTPIPVEIGNITPDWVGGVTNTLSYKNVNFSFLIDGRKGGDIFSVTKMFGAYAGVSAETAEGDIRENGLIVGQDVLAEWGAVFAATDEGGAIMYDEDGFAIPGTTENDVRISAYQYFTDYYGIHEASIIDGSFIKLREVSLGYTLPKSLVNRVGFAKAISISLIGRNLALLYTDKSNNIGIDPETAFGTGNDGLGLEQYQLPPARSLGFRINISL